MSWLLEKCTFRGLDEDLLNSSKPFDCGNDDLNEFFSKDCVYYANELLGKSYCFTIDDNPEEIACAFTISNDSIKVADLPKPKRNKVNRKIPHQKQFRSYPAVLIGRLGVSKSISGKGIGCLLMDFIKAWFVDGENKTGCRFVVVDSYNDNGPRHYYKKCGFIDLFDSEDEEKIYLRKEGDEKLKTRLMYFDLITLKK